MTGSTLHPSNLYAIGQVYSTDIVAICDVNFMVGIIFTPPTTPHPSNLYAIGQLYSTDIVVICDVYFMVGIIFAL